MKLQSLDHIAITVRDVEASAAWYSDVLGLERRHQEVWGSMPAMVCAGKTAIALFPGGKKEPVDPNMFRHFALRADRKQFAQAQEELRARGISFNFEDHTLSHSIYFEDPDGYVVEITTYDVSG
jgi:catechol 2,3-dioxygenase-like lactoylglutathione lyase family enzyme